MTTPSLKGVLILGHGSRKASALDVIEITAKRVADALGEQVRVGVAYAELSEPDINQALEAMLRDGPLERLDIVPLFLAAGRHVREQIPEAVAALSKQHPDIDIQLTAHIGPDPLLSDIVLARLEQASRQN